MMDIAGLSEYPPNLIRDLFHNYLVLSLRVNDLDQIGKQTKVRTLINLKAPKVRPILMTKNPRLLVLRFKKSFDNKKSYP